MKTYLQEAIVRHALTFRHMTTAALLAGALTLPGQIWAQGSDDITVLLRSGERISGRLEDLNNGTLFVRVSTTTSGNCRSRRSRSSITSVARRACPRRNSDLPAAPITYGLAQQPGRAGTPRGHRGWRRLRQA